MQEVEPSPSINSVSRLSGAPIRWLAISALGMALAAAGCGGDAASRPPDAAPQMDAAPPGDVAPPDGPPQATLIRIDVTPTDPRIPLGATQQLTATGVFDNATSVNLTGVVTWGSDSEALATVSNATGSRGLATTHAVGAVRITARQGTLIGATTVTVTAAVLVSLAVTPADPSVPLGRTQQLTATGTFSDTSTRNLTGDVAWASDAEARATVSNADGSRGLATARGLGAARISATLARVTAATTLTVTDAVLVSIAVTPPNPKLPLQRTRQLVATGTFSNATTQDLTSQVAWFSDTEAHATVSNADGSRGLATARAVGPTQITATLGGLVGATTLTVTDATLTSIAVVPPSPFVVLGLTRQLAATGNYSDSTTLDLTTQVTWSAANPAVASVSNADTSRGLATSHATGTTAITATLGSVTGTATMTVTAAEIVSMVLVPGDTSLALGRSVQLTALATFTDLSIADVTASVFWGATVASVATVSSLGLVTTHGVGSTLVGASIRAIGASVTITVTDPVVDVITVSGPPLSGLRVPLGVTAQFTARGQFSDGVFRSVTDQVVWTSGAPDVASISNTQGSRGMLTARAIGTAQITATLTGVTGAATATVTDPALLSIVLTPPNASVPLGRTLQMTATGAFTDGVFRDVTNQATWGANGPVTVSTTGGARGLVTTQAQGSARIDASIGAHFPDTPGIAASTFITVTGPVLDSIAVTPAHPAVQVGHTLQLSAIGTFSNATTVDLTSQVAWASDTPAVAQVSSANGSHGLLTAIAPGSAAISATLGAVVGTTPATVTAAPP
jgi:hypothetical protein